MGHRGLEYATPTIVVSVIEIFRILLGCGQSGMNVCNIGGEIACNRVRLGGIGNAVVFTDGKFAAAELDREAPLPWLRSFGRAS